MYECLPIKSQVSGITLRSFRQGGAPQKGPLKSPPRIGLTSLVSVIKVVTLK